MLSIFPSHSLVLTSILSVFVVRHEKTLWLLWPLASLHQQALSLETLEWQSHPRHQLDLQFRQPVFVHWQKLLASLPLPVSRRTQDILSHLLWQWRNGH